MAHNPQDQPIPPSILNGTVPAPQDVSHGTLKPVRSPLGSKHVLYSEVQARVAVRLVQIDCAKNPDRYRSRARGVLELADSMRRDEQNPYTGYFYLVSLAKALNAGMSMEQWRWWASNQSWDTMRSIHKRPFYPSR